MQFFAFAHLPERLQAVSRPFGELAEQIHTTLPRNAERSVALRKLLEAKDAAVRALVAVCLLLCLLPALASAQDGAGPPPDSVPAAVPSVEAPVPAAVPTLALSEPAAVRVVDVTPSPWSGVLPTVLAYLIPVVGAFLAALLGWALALLAKRLGIQTTAAQDAALRAAIRAAIGGAEEWAARKAKAGELQPSGKEKAERVVDIVARQWPAVLPADLHLRLDEELAAVEGCGATGGAVGGPSCDGCASLLACVPGRTLTPPITAPVVVPGEVVKA
jgi:hypothetical protein